MTLAILVLLTPAGAEARDLGPGSCSKVFARLADAEASRKLEGAWSRYNRTLSEPVGMIFARPARAVAEERLAAITSDFAVLYPDFPAQDFRAFVEAEWAAGRLPRKEDSWGEFLEAAYARFLEPHQREADELVSSAGAWTGEVRTAIQGCVSASCPEILAPPASLLRSIREKIGGTCLARSPSAVQGLIREIGLNWAVLGGYFVARTDHRIQEFPFAFALNSSIWAWVFSEKHCRNAVAAAQKIPFGKIATEIPRVGWGGRMKVALQEEVADWVWVPAMATTSIGLSLWFDHGFGKDRPPEFYEARWSYMVLYNAASGPVRRVLVLDPVFKRTFPALAAWSEKMVGQGRLAQAAVRTTEIGVDYGLRWGEWEIWGILYQNFMEASGVSTK